jgi:hypothetical protein
VSRDAVRCAIFSDRGDQISSTGTDANRWSQ